MVWISASLASRTRWRPTRTYTTPRLSRRVRRTRRSTTSSFRQAPALPAPRPGRSRSTGPASTGEGVTSQHFSSSQPSRTRTVTSRTEPIGASWRRPADRVAYDLDRTGRRPNRVDVEGVSDAPEPEHPAGCFGRAARHHLELRRKRPPDGRLRSRHWNRRAPPIQHRRQKDCPDPPVVHGGRAGSAGTHGLYALRPPETDIRCAGHAMPRDYLRRRIPAAADAAEGIRWRLLLRRCDHYEPAIRPRFRTSHVVHGAEWRHVQRRIRSVRQAKQDLETGSDYGCAPVAVVAVHTDGLHRQRYIPPTDAHPGV